MASQLQAPDSFMDNTGSSTVDSFMRNEVTGAQTESWSGTMATESPRRANFDVREPGGPNRNQERLDPISGRCYAPADLAA